MKTSRIVVGLMALGVWMNVDAAAPDYRPPFDKSDYVGTLGVHLNPWFPLDKSEGHTYGGANHSWKHYVGKDLWAQGMKDLLPFGIRSWVTEINEPESWDGVWRNLYRQAASNDIPVRIGMFFGFYSRSDEGTLAGLEKVYKKVGEDIRVNPRTLKAGGYPVMLVYNSYAKRTPKEWGDLFAKIDAKLGRQIYLFDAAAVAYEAQKGSKSEAETDEKFEQLLRAKLPYWDGCSGYANGYRIPYHIIRKVMNDYPQKIYEGLLHQTYTCHFQMGGNEVDLSRNWRETIEACLASKPDAIHITNLFDHYENSLVLPCYDREDFLLRYLECRTAEWRKAEFRKLDYPELVVTSYESVWLGRQDLDFEVVSFPTASKKQEVVLHLDVCDTSGKVLHTFPARAIKLDQLHVERFSIPSVDYADYRGVVPRLRYDWAGREHAMNYGPMTVLDPGMRPYRLYWARSTKNELIVKGTKEWSMDGVTAGGTHVPSALGRTQFANKIGEVWQGDPKRTGLSRSRIRRDNSEMTSREPLWGSILLPTPTPGKALHWYTIEKENDHSRSYQTLPIWETDGTGNEKVTVPLWLKDGSIVSRSVEKVRVPFWHYTFDRDYGKIVPDVSGWGHDAAVSGKGFGGGHLGHTGYNHEHGGAVGVAAPGKGNWRRDADGRGYLAFNGSNDYVMAQGGTAFPGAFTYEMRIRPAEFGREMGVIGTVNHQLHVDLLADGKLRVSRQSPEEGAFGKKVFPKEEFAFVSDEPLKVGEWAHLAVVYDLKTLSLYVNGRLAGSCAAKPFAGHEWLNFVIFGARSVWVYKHTDYFHGDWGETRITGRNLTPAEFLR